jgi:hypothetical protein
MANFVTNNTETGSSGGQIGNVGAFLPQLSWPVEVITGDEWAERDGVPDYIKIDVDGKELQILQGMRRVLTDGKIKSVLVEVNNTAGEIDSLLTECGFEPDRALMALRQRKSDTNAIYRRVK